ncbi:MAG: hypothetical protein GY940_14085 [bacterium]|nr:hypothetical protein [bacterium]
MKIRGFRIEPGEIEVLLKSHETVKEAVVIDREDSNGDKYLCAYVISDKETHNALRDWLASKLPDYMIPSYFVRLETIPLTTSGKVHRERLPLPEVAAVEGDEAPQTEMEEQLVQLWSVVLGIPIENIGVTANFFHLGGHSLKATVLATKIREQFRIDASLIEIFNRPDIRQLARWLSSRQAEGQRSGAVDEHLVLLKQGEETRPRLFFIHDGSGEVEGYMAFCNHLDPSSGYRCWGIRADRFDGYAPPDLTIEALASRYIEVMKTLQPDGPYRIVGWSLGGTIAFEMVRQLEQSGETIGSFCMMDSPPPNAETPAQAGAGSFTVESELTRFKPHLPQEMFSTLRETGGIESMWTAIVRYLESNPTQAQGIRQMVIDSTGAVIPNAPHLDIPSLIRYFNTLRGLNAARSRYVPPHKIKTAPVYFGASQSKGRINHPLWNNYCDETVTYHEVSGDHYSIFTFPGVVELSSEFEKQISR